MQRVIVSAIIAIGTLAFTGSAFALESGFTCDAEDHPVPKTIVDGTVPAPQPPQAPSS